MLRLVGSLGGRSLVFPLREGENVVGSAEGCQVRLAHPSVSRRHAVLIASGAGVAVEDGSSRNGTFVDGQRVRRGEAGAGAVFRFGQVALELQALDAADAELAVRLPPGTPPPARPASEAANTTAGTRALDTFAAERLPALLDLLLARSGAARVAAAVGAALFETLPASSVEVADGDALLFSARREAPGGCAGEARRGSFSVRAVLPGENAAALYRPLLESAASLVAAAAERAPPLSPRPASPLPAPPEPPSLVPSMQRLYAEGARAARGDVAVLIRGESGTGKEVLARFLHAASPRAQGPFVALNCAALPSDLLEAELFGIERGVATGVEARAGKFELAHGGTLFLDEIGDMSLETQARILRVLQEREVFRIGGSAPRRADVRAVAATHRDLKRRIAEGAFREDLYFRIATWVLELPPLRARRADIPQLAVHFLAREAAGAGMRVHGISRAALELLERHPWPGNVRQLEKEMARAALLLEGRELLEAECLSAELRAPPPRTTGSLAAALEDAERAIVQRALDDCGGDVERAAAELGLGRSTLYRRLKALGIAAPPRPP